MNFVVYRARPLSALPFYCHPVYLFLAAWVVMLGTLEVQVSESTFPDRGLGIILFLTSIAAMSAGFWIGRISEAAEIASVLPPRYLVDTQKMRKCTSFLGLSVLAIAAFNWKRFGAPPLLGFFGLPTASYVEYGRFKQILFPMAMALFLNSLLEPSEKRRWFWAMFSLGTLVTYVSRGNLILALAQGLILYSIRTQTLKRKIYARAFVVLVVGFAALAVIGDSRTSRDLFLEFMEIKATFRSWPTAVLWPLSYFSGPISNLCWIIHRSHFTQPNLSFLYPVLPAFLAPSETHLIALSDSHIIDGVHTYLAAYFLDFSWAGIVGCNFGIGLLCAFLVNWERVSREFLVSPVLLAAIGFIFFWDFFVYLPTIIELAIQIVIQRLCVVPLNSGELVGGEP